jgi:hypothetical protein
VDLVAQPAVASSDDDYESLGLQTLLQGTAVYGPAVGALVSALVSVTKKSANVTQVTLVIDGRSVPLSQLTDAQIEDLMPELMA